MNLKFKSCIFLINVDRIITKVFIKKAVLSRAELVFWSDSTNAFLAYHKKWHECVF